MRNGETADKLRSVAGETQFGRPIDPDVVKTFGDMLYVPRYNASFDIGDTQTLVVGASGAFGPNGTGPDADTEIGGVDFLWKWKSPRADKGFPFVKVQAEGMARRLRSRRDDDAASGHVQGPRRVCAGRLGRSSRCGRSVRVYDTVGGDVGDDPARPAVPAAQARRTRGHVVPDRILQAPHPVTPTTAARDSQTPARSGCSSNSFLARTPRTSSEGMMTVSKPVSRRGVSRCSPPSHASAALHVVATTPEYGAIAAAIGGDKVSVATLAKSTEDPHFVDAKPSHIVTLNRADVLIEGGADLEVGWLPPLLEGARNPKIAAGAPGHIRASEGIQLSTSPPSSTARKGTSTRRGTRTS